jgi:hypothetical protein
MKTIEQANAILQKRSKSVWNQYVGGSRLREGIAWALAAIGTTAGCIGISMAAHYANSISYVKETNSVDKFGQVVSRHAIIERTTDDALAKKAARDLVLNMFEIVNSKIAMQAYAQTAQGLVCSNAARSTLVGYWDSQSPLKADGSWTPPQSERNVHITSNLRRPGSDHEYIVQFTLQDLDMSGGLPATPVLYQSDIAVAPNGAVTDDNIGGYCAVHLDYTEMH